MDIWILLTQNPVKFFFVIGSIATDGLEDSVKVNHFISFLVLLAVQTSMARPYDLNTILELARERNPEIQLAKAELKRADALKLEAWSTALPKINLTMNYNRNFMDSFFYVSITDSLGRRQTNRFSVSFENEYLVNASLSQILYSFGKVGTAIEAARIFDRFSLFQYQDQYSRIITQVKTAFYRALLAQKVLDVAVQSETSAKENFENIEQKYESGISSEFELLQAKSRWQNQIPQTLQAKQDEELARNNLKALVELPIKERIELQGDLESIPALPDSLTLQQVLDSRPDYLSLLKRQRLEEKRVKAERANYFPTLSASLVYTYGARSDAFRLEHDNDNIIAGLELNIPVFSGLFTTAQVQKAKVKVFKAQRQLQLSRDTIQIELSNIYLRLKQALKRIEAARASITTARRAFEIAQTRVENGMATQLELKDSRVLLDQAQLEYYASVFDYLTATFDWEQATGQMSDQGVPSTD